MKNINRRRFLSLSAGGKEMKTANLDKVAERGMRFSNAYSMPPAHTHPGYPADQPVPIPARLVQSLGCPAMGGRLSAIGTLCETGCNLWISFISSQSIVGLPTLRDFHFQ